MDRKRPLGLMIVSAVGIAWGLIALSVRFFHDAEVLHLHLNRTGVSQLSVHTWNMTGDVDAQGFFRTEKHAVVNFELQGISKLELSDFSQQNVLASLDIMLDGEGVHVELCPSYGLGGRLDAGSVTVSVVPGAPKLG